VANTLNLELEGLVVILSPEYYEGNEEERKFKCNGGYGCSSITRGGAIFGEFLSDGESARVEGHEVLKLAEN